MIVNVSEISDILDILDTIRYFRYLDTQEPLEISDGQTLHRLQT